MNFVQQLQTYINIDEINQQCLMLPGFMPFSVDQVVNYFLDSSQFSLTFNKKTGKGYLYGVELARLRQSIFNTLPQELRCRFALEKLTAQGLEASIGQFIGNPGLIADCLVDAVDIGMGHSVFKLTFNNDSSVVVKQSTTTHADFFTRLLARFDLPFIRLIEVELPSGIWQCSEFLQGVTLSEYLQQQRPTQALVKQLGWHACLGDVCGRGDRHLENYIVVDDQLYALDISYMFWPDNDTWVQRYITGGQSECTCLDLYPMFDQFYWQSYADAFSFFCAQKQSLCAEINIFYNIQQADVFCNYLVDRLNDKKYVIKRQHSVKQALKEYKSRLVYKQKLKQLIIENQVNHALLYMYYAADKDRLTAFFLIELYHQDLFTLLS